MANPDKYLVIFYCVTAGQNGPELGTDEEEIVLLVFWVIDLHSNQVGEKTQNNLMKNDDAFDCILIKVESR